MKTFIYTESKRTISRTYGGSNYTLNVYEVIENKPVFIGEAKACTRAHKGEIHEALTVVVKYLPIDEQAKLRGADMANYYNYNKHPEQFGIEIIGI